MQEIESDNKRIREIISHEGFEIVKFQAQKSRAKSKSRYTPFDLLPDAETYGTAVSSQYYHELVAAMGCNGSFFEKEHLLNEIPESEFWIQIEVNNYANFSEVE